MRFIKQMVYGVGFLIVIGLILYGIFHSAYAPVETCTDGKQNQNEQGVDCGGVCPSCEIKTLQDIQIRDKKVFPVQDGIGYTIEIFNPNTRWGAQSFHYVISFKDQFGKVLSTQEGDSFIYPGEVKYIVQSYIKKLSADIVFVDVAVSNPQWVSLDLFSRKEVDAQNIRTGKDAQLYVSGRVVNNAGSSFSPVVVSALLFSRNGTLVAASQTRFDSIDKLSQKDFRILFSKELELYVPVVVSPIVFSVNLVQGDTGSEVEKLQGVLAELGFLNREPTKFFDDVTVQAIRMFQKENNIAQTGAFDVLTRQTLQKLLDAQLQQPTQQQKDTAIDPSRTKVFVEVK